jgi:hypothetical protein
MLMRLLIIFLILTGTDLLGQKEIFVIHPNDKYQPKEICDYTNIHLLVDKLNKQVKHYNQWDEKKYRLERNDTLFESFESNKKGTFYYINYCWGDSISVHYKKFDSLDIIINIMKDGFDVKQYIIQQNTTHTTCYDSDYYMNKYEAEILEGDSIKYSYIKEWKNQKYIKGTKRKFKKEDMKWILISEEKMESYEWPTNNTKIEIEKPPNTNPQYRSELSRINSSLNSSGIIHNTYLEENSDSTQSFLPKRLKRNLPTGRYRIYKKMDANWHGKDLLIDASILDGQLHGIYNEYDLTTGKIKIYCNYRNGQLDGKKTIYFYSKDGSLNYKKTEEWKGGILIEAASY